MRNSFTCLLRGLLWSELCFPAAGCDASVSVLIFDYAGVAPAKMRAGLAEAARILSSGGADAVWIECPTEPVRLASNDTCRDGPKPLTLVVHVLPAGATRRQTERGTGGYAIAPTDGEFGSFAGVFYDRVTDVGDSIGEAAALGHIIAHELGHLLLGTEQHSASGIMTAYWSRKELVSAAQGLLRFDGAERARLRANVARRSRVSNPRVGEGR
jgi:hypothetical protein